MALKEQLKIDENLNSTLKRLEKIYEQSEKSAQAFSFLAILIVVIFYGFFIILDIMKIFFAKSMKKVKSKKKMIKNAVNPNLRKTSTNVMKLKKKCSLVLEEAE